MARQQQVEEAREGGLRVALPSQPSFSISFPADPSVTSSSSCQLASRPERGLKLLLRDSRGTFFLVEEREKRRSRDRDGCNAGATPMRRECGEVVIRARTHIYTR